MKEITFYMKNKISRLKKVAYHEAGHAVARHYLRLPFRYVTIRKNKESLGHVLGYKPPKSFHPDFDESLRIRTRLEKMIMSYYAGHAAEFIFAGRHNWKGAYHDSYNATNLAFYYCEGEQETGAFLDWMWIRTISWLKQPAQWLAVEVLAKELLKKRRLKAKEARGIIYNAIQNRLG